MYARFIAVALPAMVFLMQRSACADVLPAPPPARAASSTPIEMPIPARGLPVPSGTGGFMYGHRPIVELDVQSDFAAPGSTTNATGTGLNGVVSGTINFAGSFTIPITNRLSASFVRDAGGDLNTTFGRTALAGRGLRATR
jgi:hypothetical protein